MPQYATLLAALVITALLGSAGISVADRSLPLLVRVAGSATGERGAADGAADAARFNYPTSVSLHASGSFALVADAQNNTIRRFDLASGQVTTLAGSVGERGEANGVGPAARFAYPSGVALSADGSFALVADTDNHTVRRIDVVSGQVTTLAGSPGQRGNANGSGPAARFAFPTALTLSADSSFALVADSDNHTVRRIDLPSGSVTTLAGGAGLRGAADGTGTVARFAFPRGVALSADSSFALVADSDNHLIRRIDLMTGNVTTLAGSLGRSGTTDGSGPAARFAFPRGIAFTADGAALVADFSNSTIRRIDLANGAVTTLLGSAGATGNTDAAGSAARLDFPAGIAVGGSVTLIADTYNHTLRRVGVVALQSRAYLPLAVR